MLEVLESVLAEASKLVLDIYESFDESDVFTKKDDSPVTKADLAVNELLVNTLEKHYPDIPIISEENKEIPYETRASFDKVWIIDPLDGTKEFINKTDEFVINVALVQNGRPIASFVSVPVQDSLYYAFKDKGAFKIKNGVTKKLEVQNAAMPLRICCSRSHLNEATESFMSTYKDYLKIPTGSALKILNLADGQADLYPRFGPTMEWDIAAPDLIIWEAGGQLLEADSRTPLAYNKENLLNPFFIATVDLKLI